MNKVTHIGLLVCAGSVGAKLGSHFWGWGLGIGLVLVAAGLAWQQWGAEVKKLFASA